MTSTIGTRSHWVNRQRRKRGEQANAISVHAVSAAEWSVQVTDMKAVHPDGFYSKYPKVTWDLAAERWTTVRARSHILIAWCESCDWHHSEAVLAKPERLSIAEFIVECQHWYSCPATPDVKFEWWRGPFKYS